MTLGEVCLGRSDGDILFSIETLGVLLQDNFAKVIPTCDNISVVTNRVSTIEFAMEPFQVDGEVSGQRLVP